MSAFDDYAIATTHLAALGATQHTVHDGYTRGLGSFRSAEHRYALTDNAETGTFRNSFLIAVLGLGASNTAPMWYDSILGENLGCLLALPKTTSSPSVTLLTRLGDYLEALGHPRNITAEIAYLYHNYLGYNVDARTTDAEQVSVDLERCVSYTTLMPLNLAERMDAARRQADPQTLQNMLNEGAPYLLAKEMFTAAHRREVPHA